MTSEGNQKFKWKNTRWLDIWRSLNVISGEEAFVNRVLSVILLTQLYPLCVGMAHSVFFGQDANSHILKCVSFKMNVPILIASLFMLTLKSWLFYGKAEDKQPASKSRASNVETLVKKKRNRRSLRKNKVKVNKNNVRLMCVNSAGISSKLHSLKSVAKSLKPSVIFIEETKMKRQGKLKL